MLEGGGWNWTVSGFILNWEHLNMWHAYVDDLPPDGNPHPLPLPPQDDEVDQAQELAKQFLHSFQNKNNQHFQQGNITRTTLRIRI
jgi:hypothetical protein